MAILIDRSKRPHISSLERPPVELLQSIASHLPLSTAASFALSNKYICYVLGLQYWQHLRSQPLEYEIFLGFLEKDMTSHWLCHQCLIFHLKPEFSPISKYDLPLPRLTWKCVRSSYYLSRTMSRPHTFPPGPISHLMVRMAINRHLLGPEHGEPLDIFSEPSLSPPLSHKTYCLRLERWGRTSTEACIVANELYVRCQHRFEISSSKNFEYIPVHDICPHISLDPGNVMEPIIKCLLSHRNTASCENCKGLGQCHHWVRNSNFATGACWPCHWDYLLEEFWCWKESRRSKVDATWASSESWLAGC